LSRLFGRLPLGDHDAWLTSRASFKTTPLWSTALVVNLRTLRPSPSMTWMRFVASPIHLAIAGRG
jgi:hypothetical protein